MEKAKKVHSGKKKGGASRKKKKNAEVTAILLAGCHRSSSQIRSAKHGLLLVSKERKGIGEW